MTPRPLACAGEVHVPHRSRHAERPVIRRHPVRTALLALLLLLSCTRAWGESQGDLRVRASLEFTRVEDTMKSVYARVIAATRGRQRAAVVASQEAWLRYRDANGQAELAAEPDLRSHPLLRYSIAIRMTQARTAELEALLSALLTPPRETAPQAAPAP